MRQRVNIWMGLGKKLKTAERVFPHVASSYSLVQSLLPDVLCNATQNVRGGLYEQIPSIQRRLLFLSKTLRPSLSPLEIQK